MIKRYDTPQTPYQRLLASGQLSEERQVALEAQFTGLSALALQRELVLATQKLWAMEAPDPVSERGIRLRQAVREATAR